MIDNTEMSIQDKCPFLLKYLNYINYSSWKNYIYRKKANRQMSTENRVKNVKIINQYQKVYWMNL